MPEPKVVVAIGACGTRVGSSPSAYNVKGGVDRIIPVDVYVPGCAAKPEAILDGVIIALGKLAEKGKKVDQGIFERLENTQIFIKSR